jgi:tetratricopeptide (TPR) repeat protein
MPAMRFLMSTFLFCLLLPFVQAFSAEQTAELPKPGKITEVQHGALEPDDTRLNGLYSDLKKTRDPDLARGVADQIRDLLGHSGSATVNMMIVESDKALAAKHYGAALDFLDQITLIAPDFADGWNRRATVHYLMGNYPKSMADTARALTLEPRHLGALAGMASILEQTGHDEQALSAWQHYLDLYPADRDAQKEVLDLMDKVDGKKT